MRTRTRRIVLAVVAVLGLGLVAACGPAAPPPSSPAAADLYARHDYARAVHGLGPLHADGYLQANAQHHADRLAGTVRSCTGGLSHSPELASWYPRSYAAENVACVPGCPTNGETAFTLWLHSPGHRGNLLNPVHSRLGVATQCNGSVQIAVAHYRSG